MKMSKRALKALRGSILHWIRMRDGEQREGEIPDDQNCPLCRLYNHSLSIGCCESCPIFQKTGEPYCHGTPYHQALGDWEENGVVCEAYAQEEIDFLCSLLPEGETPPKGAQP